MSYITRTITLEDIRAAKPEMIYYGANTCWWTHDPEHLSSTAGAVNRATGRTMSLPCDPRGGMLFQTEDVEGFLRSAEEHADAYGRHGLDAFMAAHHLNCQRSREDQRPWCMPTWDEYNDAIDASQEAQA